MTRLKKIDTSSFLNLSLTTEEGKQLFSDFVNNQQNKELLSQQSSFDLSIGYYMLTGRKSVKIYGNINAILVRCDHPNKDKQFLNFMPIYDENLIAFTEENENLTLDIISKHVTPKTSTQERSNFEYTDETVMDWIYPTYHYDTKALSQMQGGRYRKLRYALYNFKNQTVNFKLDAHIQPKTLMKWALQQSKRIDPSQPELSQDEILQTLLEGVRAIETNKDIYQTAMLEIDGEAVAYMAWDYTNKDSANFLWLIYDISIKEISRLCYTELAKYLAQNGTSNLCAGGSETETLDRFKRQFRPVKSFVHTNLVLTTKKITLKKAA